MTRRIGSAERRARLGVRHRLAADAKADTPEQVAAGLVALHATDPATVYLAAAARLRAPRVADVERALYDDRTLIRLLGMRRTVFVVPAEVAPVVQAACTDEIAKTERRRLVEHLGTQGHPDNVADAQRWLNEVAESTVSMLAARGTATAQQLGEDEPRLRQRLIMAKGKSYEAIANVSSRVLGVLAAEGRIVRGRPRGSWLSTQYHWSTTDAWLPGARRPWTAEAARVELARRWLRAFGPAQVADLRWWAGWTAGVTKKILAELGPVEVDLDGAPGLLLADDVARVPAPDPWIALLPALDPTAMGWFERDFYLGEHRAALFDRSGNIGPTVWCDGRIIGGWAQRADGEVVCRMLADIGAEATAAVGAEAARLTDWMGDVRVIPKFRTPLERELTN